MPAIAKAASQPVLKRKKRKGKSKRKKPRQLNLKGCLKTPEDWARFDAWAQVNALPKKIPKSEPIKRPAKPLSRLKKRIKVLSKRNLRPSDNLRCIFRAISKAALRAKTSKRTKRLARPKIPLNTFCHEWIVSPAALRYKPTKNIENLSRPKLGLVPEACGGSPFEISKKALKRKTTEKDDELARPAKRFKTNEDEEKRKRYRDKDEPLSPWMEFLALPQYRVLMGQHTDNAKKWKEQILNDLDVRGKQALKEKKRKLEEQRRKELQTQKSTCTITTAGMYDEDEEHECSEEAVEIETTAPKPVEPNEITEEEKEARRKRRRKKEPWRFYKTNECKEFPPKISKGALNCQASEHVTKLAEPKKNRKAVCVKDPTIVKKAALTAQSTPLIEELAKPKHQAEPVERAPPREVDEFGRPIIQKPAYGKKLPKVKPYKMAECKEKKDEETILKEEEEEMKEEERIKKSIDPIVKEPTIDPLFDPAKAEKQARERKRAAALEIEKNTKQTPEKELEEKTPESN